MLFLTFQADFTDSQNFKVYGPQYTLFASSGHNLNSVCLKQSQGLPVK